MSNSEDKNQEQQVEMSLKQWVEVIKENRENVLSHVITIADKKVDVEVDVVVVEEMQEIMKVDEEMLEIISTNPIVEHLMRIAEEDLGMWNEALVISKSLLASFFGRSLEVLQIFGVIQEFEAQSANVMEGWINYHLNREQFKGGLLAHEVHPNLLVNSDFYAAFLLLDKKMISGIKSDLSDLLNNYSVLIDVLVAATAHMHDDEEHNFDTMYM